MDIELSCEESPSPDNPSLWSDHGYRLWPGASWITPAGKTYRINGFHDLWLSEHPELARGARNVAEMVCATGWAAVTLFSEGCLELIIQESDSQSSHDFIFEILARNRGLWRIARIMTLDATGFVTISEGELADSSFLQTIADRNRLASGN